MILFYDINNIDECIWPEGCIEKNYYINLIKNTPGFYIDNVDTKYAIIKYNNIILPITINNTEYNSSYVCSPYSAFINYGKDELHKLKNKFLAIFLRIIAEAAGYILKFGKINKLIQINNSLISTNLYNATDALNVELITNFLTNKFPDHAIAYRSVYKNHDLVNQLLSTDHILLPNKYVYLIDHLAPKIQAKKIHKNDMKTLNKSKYQLTDHTQINDKDLERMTELYRMLYIEKYSKYNPQFNANYFKLAYHNNFLKFTALRNQDGKIDAMIAYHACNNIMVVPIIGYDTSLPGIPFYSMINTMVAQESLHNGYFM